MTTPYTRPELTQEEKNSLAITAHKINQIFDHKKRLAYVLMMMFENFRLTKEVNEHRTAREIEPLPTYDPTKARI